MTFSVVGVFRIDCSDMREKPSSSPPHPAKRKSSPTKTIMSLVGMVAAWCAAALCSMKGLDRKKRVEVERSGAVRRALATVSIYATKAIIKRYRETK